MTYLQHHGVKGMKWGVRKERRAKLKGARSILNDQIKRSEQEGINLQYARRELSSINRKLSTGISKASELKRLNERKALLEKFEKEKSMANDYNRKQAIRMRETLAEKYGTKKIRDIDIETRKNGDQFVHDLSGMKLSTFIGGPVGALAYTSYKGIANTVAYKRTVKAYEYLQSLGIKDRDWERFYSESKLEYPKN